ncbi:MAG: GGDEF domain-containing protein [Erythrobacter sp.]
MGVMQPIGAVDITGEFAAARLDDDGAAELDVAKIGEIVRDGTRLSDWPKELAERYAQDHRDAIYREYRFLFLLGFAACMATIALDLLANPAMVSEGVALRVGFVLPLTVLGLWAGRRKWTAILKLILGLSPVAFIAIIAHLAMHLPAADAARYLLGGALVMGIACLTTPFSIRGLVIFNTAAVVLTIATVALHDPDALAAHASDLVTMTMVGIATLAIAVRIERLRRHNYLLSLRGKLVGVELVKANSALRDLSETDALTGVRNRRWFESEFARTIEGHGGAGGEWVGLMMIDLDHFKPFNDHHGHQAGDSCLQMVAGSLSEVFEVSGAMFARYGGEEFIAALVSDDQRSITALAEEARVAVFSRLAPIEGGGRALITASIGVAIAPASIGLMREELIEMADAALYSGKNAGRNRVEIVEAGPASEREPRIESFG